MHQQKLRSLSHVSNDLIQSFRHNPSAGSAVQNFTSEVKSKAQKRKELLLQITILYSIMSTWTLYGNISTFYPPYRKEHHPSITDTMVGVVLATFEIGMLFGAPIVSITQQRVGRKNYILLGTLITTLASMGFGLSVHIENDIAFYITSLVVRFLQGLGNAASSTAMLSIVSFIFPEKREQFFGYCEAAIQCGMMIGPAVGQVLYSALGFENTFYCSALIVGLPIIAQIFLIPQKMNHLSENDIKQRTASVDSFRYNDFKSITYKTLLTNKRVVVGCASSILAMIFMVFYETIYSDHMISLGVSENVIGYLFALGCAVATIFSPIVGCLCKIFPKMILTQFAFFAGALSLVMFGPSEVLGLPQNVNIMIVGMAALGFSISFIFAPILPEIIEAVQEKEKIGENSELNDRASGLYNISYGIGCMLAPILGGLLNDFYGYRTTCDIMAFSCLGYGLLYFFINVLPYVWTHGCLIKKDKHHAKTEDKQHLIDKTKEGETDKLKQEVIIYKEEEMSETKIETKHHSNADLELE